MFNTLQARYSLGAILWVIVLLAFISANQLFQVSQTTEEIRGKTSLQLSEALIRQLDKRTLSRTHYLSKALIAPVYNENSAAISQILAPELESEEVVAILVLDSEGKIIHDGEFDQSDFDERLDNDGALRKLFEEHQTYSQLTDQQLAIAEPILIGQDVIGAIYVEVSLNFMQSDLQAVDQAISEIKEETLWKSTKAIVAAIGAIAFFAVVISGFIAHAMVSPIRKLAAQASEIGAGNYLTEKPINRNDELGELAEAISKMGENLQRRNEEISFLAYNDNLTKLPNRLSFVQSLNEVVAANQQQTMAVLFIDLDGFKSINDTFGHSAGDFLLKEIASRLARAVRDSDKVMNTGELKGVTSRIGGDEFLIFLPALKEGEDAARIAQRLIDITREPIIMAEHKLFVSASIGIALFPQDATDAAGLIKCADHAMYSSKARGKNVFSFSDRARDKEMAAKIQLEQELRDALNHLDQQFELWLQPLVDLENQTLRGAEALIRWRHPSRGLVSPDNFIPLAEETGMIIDIGNWVLIRTCQLLNDWRGLLSEDFILSVNLSSRQLYSEQTIAILEQSLEKYQVQNNLKFEVTESTLLFDSNKAIQQLDAINRLNVGVWLDDFGTGYSSLGYLNKFEVDGIKMDRSFIAGIGLDDQAETLVRIIVQLTRELGIGLIAEGIETEAQAEFMREQKCLIGQGYLFDKPMPTEEFFAEYLGPEKKSIKKHAS